jgi:hypothetical protein
MYAVFGGFQEIVKTLLGLCVLLVGKYVISKNCSNTSLLAKYAVRYSSGRQNKQLVPIPYAKLSELTIVKTIERQRIFQP